jgi:hypothetical protein
MFVGKKSADCLRKYLNLGWYIFTYASKNPKSHHNPFSFSLPVSPFDPSTGFYVVKQIFPKDFFYFYKTMLLSTDDHLFR